LPLLSRRLCFLTPVTGRPRGRSIQIGTHIDARGVTQEPLSRIAGPLLLVWILWGSSYVAIAVMVQSMAPLLGSGSRFVISAVVLAAIAAVIKGPSSLKVSWSQFRGALIMGIALFGVAQGAATMALRYVPSGVAAVIISVIPIWFIIFRFMARDRAPVLTLIGTALGIVGIAFMLLPGGTQPVGGTDIQVTVWSFVLLLGSLSWAAASWRAPRLGLPADAVTSAVYQLAVAGVFLVIVGLLLGQRWEPASITPSSWAAYGYLIAVSIVSLVAYVWLLEHASISVVGTFAYVNPAVAVALGWLLLGEAITIDVVVGLIVVVGAVVMVVSGESRRTASESTASKPQPEELAAHEP
jgi:drug/metabolite transporter (DMT)-like permease